MCLAWLLAAGFLRAEAPIDLNSPFQKVALVKAKTGEVERKQINKARLVGDSVEMEKIEGGVAVFPAQDVLAILPHLPKDDGPYTVEQVEDAIRLYQRTTADLLRQAGLESTWPQDWEKVKTRLQLLKNESQAKEYKEKEAKETEARANLLKEAQDWLSQVEKLQLPRTEKELTDLKQTGEALARKSPEQINVILEALAALSQVQPKEKGEPLPELSKLNEIQPRLIPDDLLGWLAGGVLVLSLFGLLFGLAFLSSSLTRFKEGALLGGIVFGFLGLGLLGVLIWTWLPPQVAGQRIDPRMDPKMEELGIYLKNRAKPVYYFPQRQFSFSTDEWRSSLLGYLAVSQEPVSLFKVKMKKGTLFLTENAWIWHQPLTAMGIPLPFQLTFEGKNPDLKEWETPPILKVYLGRWLLPDSIAGLIKDSAYGILQQSLVSGGLAGVRFENEEKGRILVSVPATGVRPKYELAREKKAEALDPVNAYKKEISAEELAQAFQRGHGKDFLGKFILIEGFVERVDSGSEVSGAPSASKQSDGKQSDFSKVSGTSLFGQNAFDNFYLRTDSKPIRCLIKSAFVFVQDEREDVYLGPSADTISREPFIKKGYRVRFLTEGRVEEVNKFGEIEVYGIRLDPDNLKNQIEVFDPNDPKKK